MASNISSIARTPIAPVISKRDGGQGSAAEQFREELNKQDHEANQASHAQDAQDAPRTENKQHASNAAPGAELGSQIDITG